LPGGRSGWMSAMWGRRSGGDFPYYFLTISKHPLKKRYFPIKGLVV
jgi:hypothetical protein